MRKAAKRSRRSSRPTSPKRAAGELQADAVDELDAAADDELEAAAPARTRRPLDVDQGDDELATDEALALFMRRPPLGADRCIVLATSAAGDQIVCDRSAAECKRHYVQVANATAEACDRWAHAEGREVRFRACWQASDRTLAAHQWRAGSGNPQALNGTVESFLAQQQRHLENREQLFCNSFVLLQDGHKTLHTAQDRRILSLEKDNDQLRERLRRVDDVSTEIALEQARADLEQRGRTADMVEQRVLPLLQAAVMKSAASGGSNGVSAPTAPAGERK